MSASKKFTIATPIASSPVYTSTLIVQAYQRLNVGIMIGSVIASAGVPANSVVLSTFSGIITLERQMPGDASGIWRDVQSWTIASAAGLAGSEEVITVSPEPETVKYRLGTKTGEYYSVGMANVRLGTSGGSVE